MLKNNLVIMALVAIVLTFTSCKSKKKAAEAILTSSSMEDSSISDKRNEVLSPVSNNIKEAKNDLEVRPILIDDSEIAYQIGTHYTVDTAYIVREILLIKCSYSGGCNGHEFNLYSDRKIMKSLPPQVNINLNHKNNDDPCENWITRALRFDISKIKVEGQSTILLNLNNYKHKITYNYAN